LPEHCRRAAAVKPRDFIWTGWAGSRSKFSSCAGSVAGLRLLPTLAQPQALVVELFGSRNDNVADMASLRGTVLGMLSRAFRGR
jgi:hypothetical protein